MRTRSQFRWILGASAMLIAGSVWAQPAPHPTAAPASQPAPHPAAAPASQPATHPTSAPSSQPAADDATADLAEIEAALAADAKTRQRAAPRAGEGPADGDPTGLPRSQAPRQIARTFQSLNPDISLIADIALAAFNSDDPLMAGGHDPQEDGFNLQQLELAVSAAVDPYFRFDANIVFSQFGVEVEEAYATTLALPWNLQLRAGQFLTRFGRVNPTHPHTWDFVDQSLVIGKFLGGEGSRGLGIEASLLLPLPWYVELVGSATEADGEATARSFFGADDLGVDGPLDFVFVGAIKQFFALADNWSLFWGLSLANGPNSSGRDNRSEIYGTDLYLKYRPITHGSYTVVSLQLEWMIRRRQLPLDLLQDHGLYAYLFWRFARRWATAARYEYVGGNVDDPLDPQWTGLRQRASVNVTFWPTEFSRLRLQYGYDRPAWRDDIHMVFVALEFSVGAHGAHAF